MSGDCVNACGRARRKHGLECRQCYKKAHQKERRAEERARRWQDDFQWIDYRSLRDPKVVGELDAFAADAWFQRQHDLQYE